MFLYLHLYGSEITKLIIFPIINSKHVILIRINNLYNISKEGTNYTNLNWNDAK